MDNIAFIITGQLRTFLNIKNGLKDVLILSKQHYNSVYVFCVLNSNIPDDYSILTEFFNELNINVQFVNYTLYLDEYKMTSAEIPKELKNKISHRAKALQKLKELEVIKIV